MSAPRGPSLTPSGPGSRPVAGPLRSRTRRPRSGTPGRRACCWSIGRARRRPSCASGTSQCRAGRPDFHALVLMNAVLGGHFMSRINLNLREHRGFTYGARSAYDFRRQAGPFSVQTSVQTGATGEAIREVLAEMRAIRGERPASDDELALSKATLTKGYPRNFETTGAGGARACAAGALRTAGRDVRVVRPSRTGARSRYCHRSGGAAPRSGPVGDRRRWRSRPHRG